MNQLSIFPFQYLYSMDFEPYDDYEEEMIKQKLKEVRRILHIEEEKKPLETLTNFITKAAGSLLSFFKKKTQPAQPIEKRKDDRPVEEVPPNPVQEGKKKKPLVILLKDGSVYQEQYSSDSEDDDDLSDESDDDDDQMEDEDEEVLRPINRVDNRFEKSLSEEINAPRKRVKLDEVQVYDKYYYSNEMLHCPPEYKRRLDRIEHEALSIIRQQARKLVESSVNRSQNEQDEFEYERSKSFTQNSWTNPYMTAPSEQFEQLKNIKRLRAARVDKWPIRKKIQLDQDSKSAKDIEKLMFAFDNSINRTMHQKRERIRIENERLAEIKRQEIEAEQARIRAAQEEEKRREQEKRRQEEMQRRLEEMKRRREEEEERKRKEKEEAEIQLNTPPQPQESKEQKSEEVEQSQNLKNNESPKQPSDSFPLKSPIPPLFQSPKKIGISRPQQLSQKKEPQVVAEKKVQSPVVVETKEASNNNPFKVSHVPSQSSQGDKKAAMNPFKKSPTKIFNLGEIISSNKLPSPFTNNIFMNNSNGNVKSGEELKPPTTAIPGSEEKAAPSFNLFQPQNPTSSPLFGGIFSSNSQSGSPNPHPSIKPPLNNPLNLGSQIKSNNPSQKSNSQPLNNINPLSHFATGAPTVPLNFPSLSSSGLFPPIQNSSGLFTDIKKNMVEPEAKSVYSNPLQPPSLSDVFAGAKSAPMNPFIQNDNRPLPSLFNMQSSNQPNNSSRKKDGKKSSKRIS